MDSSMIGKIEKARRYAEEARERVVFDQFQTIVKGDNDHYNVTFDHGRWSCSCHYFAMHHMCSHTMAMERILEGMLPALEDKPMPEAA